ncbi:MAG: aminoglycoside 6-adenylyltransferase [Treponema sp.]|nr:aminoglycoside 6-adenylyltransferase [Treponema sp.]
MTQDNIALLNKISDFFSGVNEVEFLGLIGSSSNAESLSDEYSDIDLILVTGNLEKYYSDGSWLSSIDDVWVTFTESAKDINYWERRCVFSKGLDVDFIIVDKAKLLNPQESFPVLNDICHKTLQVVMDKGNLFPYFSRFITDKHDYTFPTQNDYDNLVNDFYFHYLWAYKKCLRGEYWVALQCLNSYLKSKTLTMIEWYEHLLHGNDYNTFYQGRHLEKWAEESIKSELKNIFSSYNKDSIIKALDANRILFTRIAKDTAKMIDYVFPEEKVTKLVCWVNEKYVDVPQSRRR